MKEDLKFRFGRVVAMRKRRLAGFGAFLVVFGGVLFAIGLEIFSRKPCSDGGDCSASYLAQLLGGIFLAVGLALITGVTSPLFYRAWKPPKV